MTTKTVKASELKPGDGFPVSWCGRDDEGNLTWQIQSNDRHPWKVEA
ncbi:hypothetical protein SEA_LYMARA_35 [Arthrobacter phage Lymara]|uniref:Uncharacterized protein n=1 Tax=Arthrobacter phage Lymara TaxID=2599828 RepID=A0A5J6TVJ5_9CAUD|nr:hypothetical protein HYQ01_gp035 [Arthrobacter phage Lymara]QFG14836.1 hypothetical protein SEA_LYMARA_35 [Arthrobacter phage Lymara]